MDRTFTFLTLCLLLSVNLVYAQDAFDALGASAFEPCAAAGNASLFKPLEEIRTRIVDDGKTMPPDCTNEFVVSKIAGDERRFNTDRAFHWQPTNFFHMPAYFDDVPLERYGQSWNRHLQPAVSGAKFFLQIPAIPYKMGVDPPHSCISTLGHRPPGDCVPCIRQTLPHQADATLVQAAATVGLVFLLP